MMNLTQATPQTETESRYVLHRRFDRMGRLVSDAGMEKLFGSHVMVVGLGGVGSWAAESIARSGVGCVTLVDFDEICITNANRQVQAIQGLVGQKKAEALALRLSKINPQGKFQAVVKFYNHETSDEILNLKPDIIIECIDNLTAKCHLLARARAEKLNLISAGGASAKWDPTQIKVVDMSETHTDPMLQQVRKILRQDYDFPAEGKFEIPCVFSAEAVSQPIELHYDLGQGFKCVCPQGANSPHSCDRRNVIYGSASFVTAPFGFAMASWAVKKIVTGSWPL